VRWELQAGGRWCGEGERKWIRKRGNDWKVKVVRGDDKQGKGKGRGVGFKRQTVGVGIHERGCPTSQISCRFTSSC